MIIVLLQIFLIWIIVLWVYYRVTRRDGRAPIDDIGIWWLFVFMLYATLPPLAWLIQGGSYGPLSGRLFQFQPSVNEIQYLMNISLAYIGGFTSVFLFKYKRVNRPVVATQAYIDNSKLSGAAFMVILASLIQYILNALGLFRPAESYADSYAAIYELPLALRQFIKIVVQVSGVATHILIIAVFQRWPKYRFLFICYLFIILFNVNPQGSRGYIVTSLLSMVVAWHVLIRPFPQKRILVGGILGLLCFLAFGIWRQISSLSDINSLGFQGIGVGEFDSLWGNAVELLQAKNTNGINVNFETRFGELFSFVPSQLLWFEKISLNDWYLTEFYPGLKETGMGFVFGAISQAVFGAGLLEAAIRGAIIGALAVWFMEWVRTPTKVWWRFPLHLYLLIGIFSGIRETTFIQFGDLVQTWLIAPFIIAIIGASLTLKSNRDRKKVKNSPPKKLYKPQD
jgi:hypothetical protein